MPFKSKIVKENYLQEERDDLIIKIINIILINL